MADCCSAIYKKGPIWALFMFTRLLNWGESNITYYPARDKHPSLLQTLINYRRKKLLKIGPRIHDVVAKSLRKKENENI